MSQSGNQQEAGGGQTFNLEAERREGMYASDLRYVQKSFKDVKGVLTEVNERTGEIAEDIHDIKEAQISLDELMRRVGAVVDGLRDLTGERSVCSRS